LWIVSLSLSLLSVISLLKNAQAKKKADQINQKGESKPKANQKDKGIRQLIN
jgi:hypothetical protein